MPCETSPKCGLLICLSAFSGRYSLFGRTPQNGWGNPFGFPTNTPKRERGVKQWVLALASRERNHGINHFRGSRISCHSQKGLSGAWSPLSMLRQTQMGVSILGSLPFFLRFLGQGDDRQFTVGLVSQPPFSCFLGRRPQKVHRWVGWFFFFPRTPYVP